MSHKPSEDASAFNFAEEPPELSSVTPAEECHACSPGSPGEHYSELLQTSYVYALGQIDIRFPDVGVEKEFAQVIGRAEGSRRLTDRQLLHDVLTRPDNRYLTRQICFVFSVLGMDTYVLRPHDPLDYELLAEAVRPEPSPTDIDVVIGRRGPIAGPEVCNGLALPTVEIAQVYSFDSDSLVEALEKPKAMPTEDFVPAAKELLARIMQMTDNSGASPRHRAFNYLAVRYPTIYRKMFDAFVNDSSLTGLDVRPSGLDENGTLLDVIFAYTDRRTDVVEKFFVRVDTRYLFPYLVTKLSPYSDH
ncbi:cyanobactin maturation protease PatG family protein [Actinopolymorpha pittospori]